MRYLSLGEEFGWGMQSDEIDIGLRIAHLR